MDKMENNVIVQIGIIVGDVEKTARNCANLFGLPMPQVILMADEPISNTRYRGKPSTARAKGAFFQMGPVQLEFIEPVGGPSTWEEFLRTKGEGIHHIAFAVTDMDGAVKRIESRGMDLVQSGAWTGGQYAYFDCVKQLGCILELLHHDT